MIGGAEMYMPLCRECYNEKTKQQNLAIQILHSERSQSTSEGKSDEADQRSECQGCITNSSDIKNKENNLKDRKSDWKNKMYWNEKTRN